MLVFLLSSHSRLPPLERPLADGQSAFSNVTDLTMRNSLLSWRNVSAMDRLSSERARVILIAVIYPTCPGYGVLDLFT